MNLAVPQPLGKVYLVGAGPGDPGLITLRGVDCLCRADLVLYDYLVNPRILEHAAASAECVCLGRHGAAGATDLKQERMLSQAEINDLLVEAARAGKTVVRLKSGDPAVFARLAEEIAALDAAGIDYEIVPGITAALAAGSYAGIPLTHRDAASAVALVTGQQRDDAVVASDRASEPLDYAALARFPGTLVLYMGVTTVKQWSGELLRAGKPADTPVAALRRVSWPDQQTLHSTLGQIAFAVEEAKLRPPVIFVVGSVVGDARGETWFARRPLRGQRVLVTRPAESTNALRDRLAELGADVLMQPMIHISPPADWRPLDDVLGRLSQFDWMVFSSANGVRAALDRLIALGGDLRQLAGVKFACIGPGTAAELLQYRLRADCIPDAFRAESLADSLAPHAAGKRFFLARASRGREVLADRLRQAGGLVEQAVVYQSTDRQAVDPEIDRLLAAGRIDWVTVTSSAIARSMVRLLGERLRFTRLASISPITSATLRELGFEPTAEARVYTMDGLVEAMLIANETIQRNE